MTLIRQYAFDNKLSFNYQEISDKIDDLVSLAKEVNVIQHSAKTPETVAAMPISNAGIVNQIL